jgi:hypothetical protein
MLSNVVGSTEEVSEMLGVSTSSWQDEALLEGLALENKS